MLNLPSLKTVSPTVPQWNFEHTAKPLNSFSGRKRVPKMLARDIMTTEVVTANLDMAGPRSR